ncbi:murein L,D-transpeptidase catalytic domain-containing protein [Flavihumibacter solisilvae]|uniref:murein L,D-transpeptidase catalytic domain-containing protein n=1 Tax=Flavihumibacter solisilvae TaxID=1349421 RepID=UPI00068DF683|nr:murein L,D-transpeptidase catalytic domain family protein [Flavihumibacter solisilvae]
MKTKLCVAAGIGGVLLLVAYFNPYVLFSSDPTEQSRQDLMKSQGLMNYEKSNIPGLEVKTPAKIAIVNKLADASHKKAEKIEKQLNIKSSSSGDVAKKTKKPSRKERIVVDKSLSEALSEDAEALASLESDENSSYQGRLDDNSGTHVNKSPRSRRSVVNYNDAEYAVVTSNTRTLDEEDVMAPLREEAVTVAKHESSYSFRGKTKVKSSLYKYIPPTWDGFSEETGNSLVNMAELTRKAQQIAKVAKKNGYNTDYAILADMSVKSNRKRFFVVDLSTMKIIKSALVAQGRGKLKLNLDKDYSNSAGSNCTSLGMYKVGKPYDGDFGLSYRLYGLDATNSRAHQRAIVLHAMGSIPDMETNFPIRQSEGCPSVSPKVLESLSNLIDNSDKPLLMWMYDDTYLPTANQNITGS